MCYKYNAILHGYKYVSAMKKVVDISGIGFIMFVPSVSSCVDTNEILSAL